MLLATELERRTHLINLIRLLLSDNFYQINKKFWPHRGSNSQPSRFSTMLLPTELEGRTHLITLIRLLLSDYYYPGSDWNPDPKIRPVVHEKQLSGSQIRNSIRITPNFELRLPMIITSLLTKFRQNPTSSLWEILLTNKQTNRQTDTRRWLQYPAFRGINIANIVIKETLWTFLKASKTELEGGKNAGVSQPSCFLLFSEMEYFTSAPIGFASQIESFPVFLCLSWCIGKHSELRGMPHFPDLRTREGNMSDSIANLRWSNPAYHGICTEYNIETQKIQMSLSRHPIRWSALNNYLYS